MQDGLQPGGGATSDDSSLGGDGDPAMFGDQKSAGSVGGFDFSSGNEDDPGVRSVGFVLYCDTTASQSRSVASEQATIRAIGMGMGDPSPKKQKVHISISPKS